MNRITEFSIHIIQHVVVGIHSCRPLSKGIYQTVSPCYIIHVQKTAAKPWRGWGHVAGAGEGHCTVEWSQGRGLGRTARRQGQGEGQEWLTHRGVFSSERLAPEAMSQTVDSHTHTSTSTLSLHYPHTHTQAHEHYLSALFALLSSWTSTLTQSMHTVISV